MALVEGTCACKCEVCPRTPKVFASGPKRLGWVDALSGYCRPCEIDHARGMAKRWGHHGTKAEEAHQ